MALLCIQTALKDDLWCTTAMLVDDTTLWLPVDHFHSNKADAGDSSYYVTKLKTAKQQLQPVPASHHSHKAGLHQQ